MYMGKKPSVYSMTMQKKFVVDQDATEKITLKPGYIDKVYAKGDKWQ